MPDDRRRGIEDERQLLQIGDQVRLDFLFGEHGSSLIAPRRISDPRREVTHDENDLMPQVLKRPQLAQGYGMSDVKVGPGGVEALLHDERLLLPS